MVGTQGVYARLAGYGRLRRAHAEVSAPGPASRDDHVCQECRFRVRLGHPAAVPSAAAVPPIADSVECGVSGGFGPITDYMQRSKGLSLDHLVRDRGQQGGTGEAERPRGLKALGEPENEMVVRGHAVAIGNPFTARSDPAPIRYIATLHIEPLCSPVIFVQPDTDADNG